MKNYLLDYNFLYELDQNHNKITYARITSLTSNNYPVERIEGVVTAGSINLEGRSAVRRTCSLTLTTNNLNINNIYWSLTTRIKVEIGLQNNLINYKHYPDIIWFPQGVYILTDFKPSAQVNAYTIKITGKDKMCLLNGDVSGSFNAETQLDVERIFNDDGSYIDEKKPLSYIIREMIHHYAQEDFHNIIIKDIDNLSLKILSNNSDNTFYLIQDYNSGEIIDITNGGSLQPRYRYHYRNQPELFVNFSFLKSGFIFEHSIGEDDLNLTTISHPTFIMMIDEENSTDEELNFTENNYVLIKVDSGEDIGYELTETYYPDELIAGIGDTVTSILDKIIKTFGTFEYFYNLNGQFVFQAKQTYVNNAWNNIIKNEDEHYIEPQQVHSNIKYSFEGSQIITAYSSNPQIGKIKNDFTIWGNKKLASGISIPIHGRYAIDTKPSFYTTYNNINYISEDFFKDTIKLEYEYETTDSDTIIIINEEEFQIVDWREIIYQMSKDYYQHNHDDDYSAQLQRNNNKNFFNIKTGIYTNIHPYEKGKTGYEQYYHDINGFWRTLYLPKDELNTIKQTDSNNIQIIDINNFETTIRENNYVIEKKYTGPWNKNIEENPSNLIFWFDFFDADSLGLGQFSIPAIGDRPKNEKNENIQAIIYNDVPEVIFIDQDIYDEYNNKGRLLSGYSYLINSDIFLQFLEDDRIRISTRSITIQEAVDDLLYNNAYCNEQINLTAIPIYYLEPNTIISASDDERGINGYYIIDKITLPLDYNGTMTINAIKVPERIY